MRYTGRSIFVLTAAAMAVGAAPAAAETVYGVTSEADPSLVTFDSATPGTFTSDVEITGVTGDIVGVDVRPATLQILLLDDAGQFYELDAFSGAATALGTANASLAGATDIDFNPTVDRIRIVGQDGSAAGADALGNARANPNNGAPVDGDPATAGTQPDGDLKFVAGDPNAGDAPVVPATAYTNSFPASQTFPAVPTTGQFNLEAGNDALVQQTNPNAGELTTRRPLGVDLAGPAGFDVVTDADGTTNRGYAAFQAAGAATASFYSVDTTTGPENALGKLGDFPAGRPVTDIAVAPTTPLLVALLDSPAGQALSAFTGDRPQDAGQSLTRITGLPAGTELLGIDQRPATGALYGLGSNSRLYTIDVLTGRATVVGTAGPFTPALDGTDFGFDFNPAVDRVRITSNTGQNLRVNPDTGLGVVTPPSAADGTIKGTTNSVTASAYTNSTRPAPATTTLYNLDTNRAADTFTRQNPPNDGTQEDVGPLGQDLAAGNGFDIWSRFNHGFAVSGDQLFNVNVAGAAMMAGNGGAVVSGDLGIDGLTSVAGLAVYDRALTFPPATTPTDPGTGGGGGGQTPPGTPPATPGTPTTPPAAPARSRSRISYSVSPRRDRSAPFRYTIRGRIVPRGNTPATGVFDGGRVTVLAKKSGTTRTLKRKTARVTSTGRFSVRVTVPGRTLRKNRSGVVRLNLRFNGTDALFASRAFPRARYR